MNDRQVVGAGSDIFHRLILGITLRVLHRQLRKQTIEHVGAVVMVGRNVPDALYDFPRTRLAGCLQLANKMLRIKLNNDDRRLPAHGKVKGVDRHGWYGQEAAAPSTNQPIAFVNPNGDIVIVDRCQGAGTIAFKVGTEVAAVNYTDGLHTFVIKSATATITNKSFAEVVRSNEYMPCKAFAVTGHGIVLPRSMRTTAHGVDIYNITGRLVGHAATGAGAVEIGTRSTAGNQLFVAVNRR